MQTSLTPTRDDLWFLPLGGTGEIGMNMNLYGHNGAWIMVDCGVTFGAPLKPEGGPEYDVVSADPNFITQRADELAGLLITHAHEDHVGAVAHLWPRLKCPVYTTAFTAAFLNKKLAEAGLSGQVPIHIVDSDDTINVGPFSIHWLPLTHSLPEPHALVIETEAGTVFHTGDWKIDANPVIGDGFDPAPFQALAERNIDAMVCDSTNANRAGRSLSESDCYPGLKAEVEQAKGRVVVACFGSNVARLATLAKIAEETGRYFGLLGRSLLNMYGLARQTGYWPSEYTMTDPGHLGYLPPDEVLIIATGSQGEPRTALHRLATDTHYDVELAAGDTVIFSAIVIPGNEEAIARLVDKLKSKGIKVVMAEETELPIHASGHPCADEVTELYQWVQPRIAVPTHGEQEHLKANAKLARYAGVERQLTGLNGDLFELGQQPRLRRKAVKTGRIILRG